MGHSANEMLRQIVRAAGDAGKCHVLSDMGVYVTKAARLVGIPADHIVEISNHALLLDPSIDHGGRSLSILSKVTAADHAGRLGLFTYDAHTNTVATMKATLDRLGVTPHTAKQEVRNRVVAEMMQHGRLNSLSVKSREIVDAFDEEFGSFSTPLLQCLNGRLMLQCALWDQMVVG